jgi:hypothetical protein
MAALDLFCLVTESDRGVEGRLSAEAEAGGAATKASVLAGESALEA